MLEWIIRGAGAIPLRLWIRAVVAWVPTQFPCSLQHDIPVIGAALALTLV